MTSDPPHNDDAIDDLYRGPREGFIQSRNALSRQLQDESLGEQARAVRALAKPSVSAWTVNQLWWKHREAAAELSDAAAVLRAAELAVQDAAAARARAQCAVAEADATRARTPARLAAARTGLKTASTDLERLG